MDLYAMQKGATVAKGKTDANGKLVVDSLFMGKYELKETLTNERICAFRKKYIKSILNKKI